MRIDLRICGINGWVCCLMRWLLLLVRREMIASAKCICDCGGRVAVAEFCNFHRLQRCWLRLLSLMKAVTHRITYLLCCNVWLVSSFVDFVIACVCFVSCVVFSSLAFACGRCAISSAVCGLLIVVGSPAHQNLSLCPSKYSSFSQRLCEVAVEFAVSRVLTVMSPLEGVLCRR